MKKLSYICLLLLLGGLVLSFYTTNDTPKLIEFISSECVETDVYKKNYKNRIIKSQFTDSIQWYTIFVVTHCNGVEEGKIEFKKDTIHLKYHQTVIKTKIDTIDNKRIKETVYSKKTDCNCGFNLTYKITGLQNKKYVVTANDKIIERTQHKYKIRYKKPKFEFDGKDTINLIDIYGLKQGLHIFKRKDGTIKSTYHFIDGDKISGVDTWLNFNGFSKVETYISDKKYTKRKYYRNGKLIKTCDTDGSFDEGTNCVYLD